MPGILFIRGDANHARSVFRNEGRGYWSAGLPVVLEKHGYLGFLRAGPEALHDDRIWDQYDVVLVATLPPGWWSEDIARRAMDGRAGVLVEGPLPPELARVLGVEAAPARSQVGVLTTVDLDLYAAAAAMGYKPAGRVDGSSSNPVSRRPELDWTAIGGVPLEAGQAAAWRRPGWDVERWSDNGMLEPVAMWIDEVHGDRWCAVGKAQNIAACSFGLFGFLAQRHTSEPYEGAEHRNAARSTGIEHLLLALVDELHRIAGATRPRVLPWPAGIQWVRSVRHDFDRPLRRQDVRAVLDEHDRAGAAATWYWRSRHAGSDALPEVARRRGHEVALHTELLWQTADDERRTLESAIGQEIRGTSAHGDPDCFRYQGAPNVLWAEDQGLEYTELIQQAHFHPHRFAALAHDGAIVGSEVICLPHHESFDRSSVPGDTNADHLERMLPIWIETGGFLQVMNHPDQNREELFELLRAMPTEARADWTAGQASRWWRRTHVTGALIVRALGDDAELRAREAVEDLVVELADPDGTRWRFALDLVPGRAVCVREGRLLVEPAASPMRVAAAVSGEAHVLEPIPPPEPAPEPVARSGRLGAAAAPTPFPAPTRVAPARLQPRPDRREWTRLAGEFGHAAREYLVAQGRDVSDPAVLSTVRTNSELVPARGADLIRLVRTLTPLETIAGLRVLDLGCGWGALAAYLAMRYRPESLRALDVRDDFVQTARGITAPLGLAGLEYGLGDMEALEGVEDEAFDLVLANNAFIYLPTRVQQQRSLRAMWRVLRPGGAVVMYHANRWQLREPFTRSPLVHLVPAPLGPHLARLRGWQHNVGRVRYPSAMELRVMLWSAGFSAVRVGLPTSHGIRTGPRAHFGRFYGIGASRPLSSRRPRPGLPPRTPR